MASGEFDIIERYFSRRSRRADVVLGVGDDAALLVPPAGRELVAAVDTIHAGVHFPPTLAAADVGYRALAVNLSDLAAMAAEPAWMLLALSLDDPRDDWLEGFACGLYGLAERFDVALIGGDTVRGPLGATLTLLGSVEPGQALRRAGARAGDQVWVSGFPGEAAAGLALLQGHLASNEAAARALIGRFRRPEPRVALGRRLRGIASAAIDVSDGLYADLAKLAATSGVGAALQTDQVPLSAALIGAAGAQRAREFALGGGDDYELCFTAPDARTGELIGLADAVHVPLHRIGEIVAARGIELLGTDAQRVPRGHDHFAAP